MSQSDIYFELLGKGFECVSDLRNQGQLPSQQTAICGVVLILHAEEQETKGIQGEWEERE